MDYSGSIDFVMVIYLTVGCGIAIGLFMSAIWRKFKRDQEDFSFDEMVQRVEPRPIFLGVGKLCLDCSHIYVSSTNGCPVCTSQTWVWLSKWHPLLKGDSI